METIQMTTLYRTLARLEQCENIDSVLKIIDNLPDDLDENEIRKLHSFAEDLIEGWINNNV